MKEINNSNLLPGKTDVYEIRVGGYLDQAWADWFDDFEIYPQEDGTTIIEGHVVDDAALYGLLKKVRDAGLKLISVNQTYPSQGQE